MCYIYWTAVRVAHMQDFFVKIKRPDFCFWNLQRSWLNIYKNYITIIEKKFHLYHDLKDERYSTNCTLSKLTNIIMKDKIEQTDEIIIQKCSLIRRSILCNWHVNMGVTVVILFGHNKLLLWTLLWIYVLLELFMIIFIIFTQVFHLALRPHHTPLVAHLQQSPVQKCDRYRYYLPVDIALLSLDTRKLLIHTCQIIRGLSVILHKINWV